jgi:precorrin-3B synthase
MSVAPSRKGWCPSLLSPMQSGDGWLVRVKPAAANMSTSAARIIAEAARQYGNGHIDLTRRANLQLRGLTPHSAEHAGQSIIAAALASADAGIETIRNVMASPLGPDDDTAPFDSHSLAWKIEAMLAGERALHALPSKFGLLVDGGGVLPLAGVTADIMVHAHADWLAICLDGGVLAALCPAQEIVQWARALALAFLALAARRTRRPTRMRSLVLAVGEEAIFAAAGLSPVRLPFVPAPSAPAPVGFIPFPGQDTGTFGAGLPFGRIEAEALTELAHLSEKFGDATLRTTPWRTLLIPGVAASNSATLVEAVRALGLIADPTDPRLAIFACVGAPACVCASVDARADAARLAASAAANGLRIHVSGCAKGCAHASPAALTLVGRDGRYDLVRDGKAGDPPARTGLSIAQVIAQLDTEQRSQP